MKNCRIYLCLLAALLILSPDLSMAANPAKKKADITWTRNASKRNGLYSKQNNNIANGLTFSINAMYYYGDVDIRGLAFADGFQVQNLSLGGAGSFAYSMPLSRHCNWRFAAQVGSLRGDNSAKYPDSYRKFESIFVEPNIGVEYYPFSNAGWYLYAGVTAALGFIKYDFLYDNSPVQGRTFSFLPMVAFETGYDIPLGRSFTLRPYIGLHQGIMDAPGFNLDGYPMTSGMNNSGVSFGRGGGNKWADGFFMVGLSLTYRWHNCKVCREYK